MKVKIAAGSLLAAGLLLQAAGAVHAESLDDVMRLRYAEKEFGDLAYIVKSKDASPAQAPEAPVPVLTENDGPGLVLWRLMKQAEFYLHEECSNINACDAQVQQEINAFAAFSAAYIGQAPKAYKADKTLGDLAFKLASDTCGQTIPNVRDEGNADWNLAKTQNYAIVQLKELQAAAGRTGKGISSCEWK